MAHTNVLNDFLNAKKVEGKSSRTITQYSSTILKLQEWAGCDLTEITTTQIRGYLAWYKEEKKVKNTTADTARRIFSSFYTWCTNNGYITVNPCAAVVRIKAPKVKRDGFSEEELDAIREHCHSKRDRAMVEFLYSSGVRISEFLELDKDDIDWNSRSCVVHGKGDKERTVYFSVPAAKRLKEYIDSRTDDNDALMVSLLAPFNRLTPSGAQTALKKIGSECNIHVHPHRFRHTCATYLLTKGMPIEEVSRLLGHEKLETTMIYCTVNDDLVAMNYKRMMI